MISQHSIQPTLPATASTAQQAKFLVTFPVRFQDTDNQLRASLTGMLGAMQEAAILNSEAVGRGISWLAERNLSWILAQIRSVIFRRPTWQQQIRVVTWFSEIGSLMSRREFSLTDEKQRTLLHATTLWTCIHASHRKPIRAPADLTAAHQVLRIRALDVPFRRPARPQNHPKTRQCRFTIRHRHIDFNGHVNNLRYLEWMLETLPENIENDYQISALNIRFQKEAGPKDSVMAVGSETNHQQEETRQFTHEIFLEGTDETLASAETTWVLKEDQPKLPQLHLS